MASPVYIGDETSAAGWRLAGARVSVPAPGDEAAALASATRQAPLVLLSAAVASRIGAAALAAAGSTLSPLVLLVPDPQGEVSLPGLADRLRSQLGLEP
jgi:vacuolar-type H+-ATPase subunit F/Vma7